VDFSNEKEALEMKSKAFIVSLAVFVVIPLIACPITLVRVGYINLDNIIKTYTEKYLDTEISIREQYVQLLQSDYNMNYFTMTDTQREQLQEKISNQRTVLNMLRFNMAVWKNTDELREDLIYRIVQRDIMEAIKKTSELEGFNLILDNTGNFVYGSDDINLTDKVFFRLDEKLLDLQNKEPVAPLDLELEGQQEGAEYLND
jgi:Skp family chaperone for outer membrane proteins